MTTSDAPPLTVNVKKDAVIGIRLDHIVTTETARVDDKVTARVARDVVVDGRTAIPAGARLEGIVTLVERGGHSADRCKIGMRFNTLIFGESQRVSIQTDTIFRDSEPGEPSAALGASAAFGAMVTGAGRKNPKLNTSTGAPMLPPSAQSNARIPGGSLLTLKLTAPLSIVIAGR